MDPLRILITDDHTLFREGLAALLKSIAGLEVVGEAAGGEQAIAQAEALQPDVVLMDIQMRQPGGAGIKRPPGASSRPAPHIGCATTSRTSSASCRWPTGRRPGAGRAQAGRRPSCGRARQGWGSKWEGRHTKAQARTSRWSPDRRAHTSRFKPQTPKYARANCAAVRPDNTATLCPPPATQAPARNRLGMGVVARSRPPNMFSTVCSEP